MRKPLIAGNWKMNKNIEESLILVEGIKNNCLNKNVNVLICPPFTGLYSIKQLLNGTDIKLGAQNMHYEKNGAYTGEISPEMLKEIGIEYVIIGHSERRQYFNESDEYVNLKLKAALYYNIKPILCVGEDLELREKGLEKEKVYSQIVNAFKGIKEEELINIAIAYEPIWAIGTGKTASSLQANEMATYIRKVIKEMYSNNVSEQILILYGGSVKSDNITDIMAQSDIDGVLVGGASLKSDEFTKIINYTHMQ